MKNINDELEESHQLLLQTVSDLPESEWEVPGVAGNWSVKEVVAHLTAYELGLLDILRTLQGAQPTPYVLKMTQAREEFNQETVESRRYQTAQQVLTEYQDVQVLTTSQLSQIAPELIEAQGKLAWYDKEMSLAELVDHLGQHTRRHCEQIAHYHSQHDSKD